MLLCSPQSWWQSSSPPAREPTTTCRCTSRPAPSAGTGSTTPTSPVLRQPERRPSSRPTRSWSPPTRTPSSTSTSAAAPSPRWSPPARPVATAASTASIRAYPPTARESSSTPRRSWSPPTPTTSSTSTSAPAGTTTRSRSARRWHRRRSTPASAAHPPTARRVFFDTEEKLVAADTDAQFDVYERSGGTTTLLSTGPSGGNGSFFAELQRLVDRRQPGHLQHRRIACGGGYRRAGRPLPALRWHDDAGVDRIGGRQRRLRGDLRRHQRQRLPSLLQHRRAAGTGGH